MAAKLGVFFYFFFLQVLHTSFSSAQLFKVITEHYIVHMANSVFGHEARYVVPASDHRLLSGVPRNEVATSYTVVTIVRVSE